MSNRWVSYNSIRSDLNQLSDFYYQEPKIDICLVGNEPPPPPRSEEYHDIESEEEEDEAFCGERYSKGPNLNLIGDMLRLVEEEEVNTDALKGFVSKPPEPSPRHVYIDIQKPSNAPKGQPKNIIPVSIERNTPVDKPPDYNGLTSMIPSFGFRKAIACIQQQTVNENKECNLNNTQPVANGLSPNVPEFVPRTQHHKKNHLTPGAPEFIPGQLLNSQPKHLSYPNSVRPCNINGSRSTDSEKKIYNNIISKELHSRNVLSVPDKKIVKRKIVKDKPEDLVDVFNICNSELPYANKQTYNLTTSTKRGPVTNSNSITQNSNNAAIESILRMSQSTKQNDSKTTPKPATVKLLTPNDFKISSEQNNKAPTKPFNIMDEIRKLGLEGRECKTPITIENIEKIENENVNTIEPSAQLRSNVLLSCIPTVDTLQSSCLPAFTGHDKVNEWLNGPRPKIVRPKEYPQELLKPFGFRKNTNSNNENPSSSTTLSKEFEMSSSSCRSTPIPDYQPRASYYEIHAKLLKSAEEKEKSRVQTMDWWEKAEHLMKKREEEQRNMKRISKTK